MIQLIPQEKADVHSLRGNAYIQKGEPDSAAADFKAALLINPEHQGAKKGLESLKKRKPTTAGVPTQNCFSLRNKKGLNLTKLNIIHAAE
jgi:hypothetical protein